MCGPLWAIITQREGQCNDQETPIEGQKHVALMFSNEQGTPVQGQACDMYYVDF